jgi:CRISPR-associated protein Cas1
VRTVFVVQDSGVLRREGARIIVQSGKEVLARLQTEELEQLVVVGDLTLTPAVIDLLAQREVDTVLLSRHGRFRARVGRSATGNVKLRLTQYALATGGLERKIALAKGFVAAKVHNQCALLSRGTRRSDDPRLPRAIAAMQAVLLQVPEAATMDELRGLEGAAAAAYFKAFGALLKAEGFAFEKRSRRPPMDPVNALLSLGYTLLAERIRGAVETVGLDPELGVLHEPENGRPALVLDLEEEFRAPVVDALVVAAINLGAIRPEHFEDAGAGEPVVVRREGLRQFFTLFGRRLERKVKPSPAEDRLSFRGILLRQAQAVGRYCLKGEPYAGFVVR